MIGRALLVVAVFGAALAPLIDGGAHPGGPDLADLESRLAPGGGAWIDPVALGEAIRDRTPVTVLDLRAPDARAVLAIPGSRPFAVAELATGAELGPSPVLVDGGDGTAVRAWLLAVRLGHADVRVLEGGVPAWVTGVLDPVLPVDTAQQRARFERVAAVSRYFGGMPRIGVPVEQDDAEATASVTRIRRRGCL